MKSGASEHDGELRPGDVCEGYRVVSLIAAGGMGDVYEAVHLASGVSAAIALRIAGVSAAEMSRTASAHAGLLLGHFVLQIVVVAVGEDRRVVAAGRQRRTITRCRLPERP